MELYTSPFRSHKVPRQDVKMDEQMSDIKKNIYHNENNHDMAIQIKADENEI